MFLSSDGSIIKSFDLTLYFDDDTQKQVIATEGDKIYVEFLEDSKLYTMSGILKAINTILDDTNEICLTIDGSTEGQGLIKHVKQSSIRDLSIIEEQNNTIEIMYGVTGYLSVALTDEEGNDYELADSEELKLYIRNKDTFDVLVECTAEDKANFVIPAEELTKIGVGEYVYNVFIESEGDIKIAIPYSKLIIWR